MSGAKRRSPSSTSPRAHTSKESAPEAVAIVEASRFDVADAVEKDVQE